MEPHTELEVPPHGQGQCFTQHERHPHTEFDVQAPHEETHCAFRNTEAQIPTAFGKKYAKRQSGETRTSHGRFVSMLFGNALNGRLSTPPSRCRRRSRLRATMEHNNPDVQFILDALVGSLKHIRCRGGPFCSKIKVSTHSAKVCQRESN